jgi:transcriptional regulator of acetoin/glycerol metabolism
MTLELASALLLHAWPFNVRGLLNILTAAELSSPPPQPLALCAEVRQALATDAMIQPPPPGSLQNAPPRERLEQALRAASGRVSGVARALGCTRQQIYRWIALHQIDVKPYRR